MHAPDRYQRIPIDSTGFHAHELECLQKRPCPSCSKPFRLHRRERAPSRAWKKVQGTCCKAEQAEQDIENDRSGGTSTLHIFCGEVRHAFRKTTAAEKHTEKRSSILSRSREFQKEFKTNLESPGIHGQISNAPIEAAHGFRTTARAGIKEQLRN